MTMNDVIARALRLYRTRLEMEMEQERTGGCRTYVLDGIRKELNQVNDALSPPFKNVSSSVVQWREEIETDG